MGANKKIDSFVLYVADIARWVLVALLSATSLAKLLSGYDRTMIVSKEVYYAACVMEIIAVGCLVTRRWMRAGAVVAVLLSLAGTAVLYWVGPRCGCVGAWARLSIAQHAALAGVVGLAGVAVVDGIRRRREHSGQTG